MTYPQISFWFFSLKQNRKKAISQDILYGYTHCILINNYLLLTARQGSCSGGAVLYSQNRAADDFRSGSRYC